MPLPNAAFPIVREDRTMELPFQSFIIDVHKQIPFVGTGSPEGVVPAPYLSIYLDTSGGEGLVSYRKMLPDIGGDKTQGWIKLSVPSASFEVLDDAGDIGTGAGQIAQGNHTHNAFSDQATTPYTLVLSDADTLIRFTAANHAVTIPVEASVDFPIGTQISIRQAGTGTLVLTTTSLTINGTVPGWAQHVEVKFRKVAADTWDVV